MKTLTEQEKLVHIANETFNAKISNGASGKMLDRFAVDDFRGKYTLLFIATDTTVEASIFFNDKVGSYKMDEIDSIEELEDYIYYVKYYDFDNNMNYDN